MEKKEFIFKLKIISSALNILIKTMQDDEQIDETIKLRAYDLLRKIDNLIRFI